MKVPALITVPQLLQKNKSDDNDNDDNEDSTFLNPQSRLCLFN